MRTVTVAATPWEGRCPLRYTTDFYTPAELDAALARWNAQYCNFGSYPFSHMWHPAIASKPLLLEHHQLHLYHADGRCNLHMYGTASPGRDQANHDHTQQPLPGSRMSQAICTSCRWHHIDPDESAAVEAWHDHAMPGWRSLPVQNDRRKGLLAPAGALQALIDATDPQERNRAHERILEQAQPEE